MTEKSPIEEIPKETKESKRDVSLEQTERYPEERSKLEERLYPSFATLKRSFDGGMLSDKFPGWTENANICILTKDNQGEFAAKIGWGDFALEAPKGNPNELKDVEGPAFVLRQFGAYLLDEHKFQQWKEKPRDYLFENAKFIIDRDTIYARAGKHEYLQQELTPDTLKKVKFVDFNDPKLKEKFEAKDAKEYIRNFHTKFIKDTIGSVKFEDLIDKLSGPDGDKIFMRLGRAYYRWVHLLVGKEPYRPELHKDENVWQAELKRGDFLNCVFSLTRERNIDTMRDKRGYDKARIDALREFDPNIAYDVELSEFIRLLHKLQIYHRDQLLVFGSKWDRDKEEFRQES